MVVVERESFVKFVRKVVFDQVIRYCIGLFDGGRGRLIDERLDRRIAFMLEEVHRNLAAEDQAHLLAFLLAGSHAFFSKAQYVVVEMSAQPTIGSDDDDGAMSYIVVRRGKRNRIGILFSHVREHLAHDACIGFSTRDASLGTIDLRFRDHLHGGGDLACRGDRRDSTRYVVQVSHAPFLCSVAPCLSVAKNERILPSLDKL